MTEVDFDYSGNPGDSDLNEVRFLIQDTDPEDVLLTDTELQYLLDKHMPTYNSTYYVAAIACETLAARYAREISYSADGVSLQTSELQTKYKQLAEDLRDQYKATNEAGGPDAGGILFGEYFDSSIQPLLFSIGMHDNREAGRQDYGGTQPEPLPEVSDSV